jgi:hypothetical protein
MFKFCKWKNAYENATFERRQKKLQKIVPLIFRVTQQN